MINRSKCDCGLVLGIDEAGWEYHDLNDSKYAPLFKSFGVPAAYRYEAGTFLSDVDPVFHSRWTEFTDLIAKDVGIPSDGADTVGIIISNGWTWRYIYASKLKELEEHARECRAKKRKKEEIEECSTKHRVVSEWVYDGGIQHKHTCSCGREWSERIE